jgi:hypothetical protein
MAEMKSSENRKEKDISDEKKKKSEDGIGGRWGASAREKAENNYQLASIAAGENGGARKR